MNLEKSGWPQFVVHFYDKLKSSSRGRVPVALERLKAEAIFRVPRDIESYLFRNRIDLSKYSHNKNQSNATQSQQYVMDLIDKKFEKLKDRIYKLGIKPVQFRTMVENHTLIEWSPEICLALSSRFCSWIVQEEDENFDETEDGRSVVRGSMNSVLDRKSEMRDLLRRSQLGSPKFGQPVMVIEEQEQVYMQKEVSSSDSEVTDEEE